MIIILDFFNKLLVKHVVQDVKQQLDPLIVVDLISLMDLMAALLMKMLIEYSSLLVVLNSCYPFIIHK
jgi:hypothetical protein